MSARQQGGFVLLAVLAAIVVLTLIATAIGTRAERAVEDQRRQEARLDAELAIHSTEATVLYLAASQRMTFGGLTVDEQVVQTEDELAIDDFGYSVNPVGNEIRLDGRAYRGVRDARFSLQDERGKVSPAWADDGVRERFVDLLGGEGERAGDLLAALLDYQDEDDLKRLNGGERDEYVKAGLEPPPNRPLTTPLELRRVLGWNELLAGLDDARVIELLTLTRVPGINPNTGGIEPLMAMFAIDSDEAQRIVGLREESVFLSAFDLARVTDVPIGEEGGLLLMPGESFTLSTWTAGDGTRRTSQWTLTPVDDGGMPWRSEYGVRLPSAPVDALRDPLATPPATIFLDTPVPAG
ncbi:MAG: general secretion pathway protein GspK [Pseudomonadota bacterium]|jgi:type II secretory pathway component PulK|nr:type II secretion system protein GspK [Silanimonas sp.]